MHSVTRTNLEDALAGEAFESFIYWLFEQQAEQEGLHEIARLFGRIADEERRYHGREIARLLGLPRHTRDNLRAALTGEFSEHRCTFPRAAGQALEAGDLFESLSLQSFGADEHRHADGLRTALFRLDRGDFAADEAGAGTPHPRGKDGPTQAASSSGAHLAASGA
jgi:rubrerythrin